MNVSELKVGLRVITNAVIDIYPLNVWPAGTKGTVVEVETEDRWGEATTQILAHVLLDAPYPCLAEWHNCLMVWEVQDEANSEARLSAFDVVEGERLFGLAQAARCLGDDDWGSERQQNAENDFFDAFHDAVGDTHAFDAWCLKATTEEMIDEALRLLGLSVLGMAPEIDVSEHPALMPGYGLA
jgi:hypothetical protein